jgi:uncharacterized protein (TIGR02246 family)
VTVIGRLDTGDLLAIEQLYARYTHAYDGGQADRLARLFTADGTFERPGGATVRGTEELAAMATAAAARGAGTRHLVSAVLVEPGDRPDTATGSAYVQVVGIGPDAVSLVAIGRYDDEFVRQDEVWAFRARRFTAFTGAALAGATLASA